jgi:uncharacterized cupin superfamily protein
MGRFREEPGFMTSLHFHHHTDEQVYVIDGVLSVYFADKWHELGPGTLGVLPMESRTPRAIAATSRSPLLDRVCRRVSKNCFLRSTHL